MQRREGAEKKAWGLLTGGSVDLIRTTGGDVFFEMLESRMLLSSSVRFAVIGDFGGGDPQEADVANRIKAWNPDLVLTTGDDNYPSGAASTIDRNIGRDYHSFIYPYTGAYGAGAADGKNHFFPTLGNHDWYTAGARPYLDYFTLPGNERYYTFMRGPVQFFAVDSDPNEPDLNTTSLSEAVNSPEAKWLKAQLAASSAEWKVVYFHQAPYSSGSVHGDSTWMQWPFKQWGASVVLSGHDHTYERLSVGGLPYFVNGIGGYTTYGFKATPVAGSVVRYNADYGAQFVTADDASMQLQFITRTGTVVDSYTIHAAPAAPSELAATAASTTQINLAWHDNSNNEAGFILDRSSDGTTYSTIATLAANITTYEDKNLRSGTIYYYRIHAFNGPAKSLYTPAASAATNAPFQPVPSPWRTVLMGAPVNRGSAGHLNGVFALAGAGNIGGYSDSFRFIYRTLPLNGQIVARITSLSPYDPWSAAGIMIRPSLAANSANASVLLTGLGPLTFEWRGTMGGKAAFSSKRINNAPLWVKLTRRGSVVTGYTSSDGAKWTSIGSVAIAIPKGIYVGLVASSHSSTVAASATFDHVVVTKI